jgi:4-hydroxybenzoyl-CoA thioesterase
VKFEHRFEVTFGDADAAGIAYYPRILDYCHRAFERFFAEAVGEPYARVYLVNNIGFPTVGLEASFKAPMRFGDAMTAAVSIDKFSERSVSFRYEFRRADGTLCAVITNAAVAVDRVSFKPVAIPAAHKAAFEKYLTDAPAAPR